MILKMGQVSKCYQGRKIFDRFSVEIGERERVVLWGPSGCGKTTLLKIIAGLVPPDEGSIFLDGVLVSRNGKTIVKPEKRSIGMVFQDLALWPHMTVYENIAFGLKAKQLPAGEIKEQVETMLEMVQLTRHKRSLPGELSGGEQQRVAVSRALVTKPRLLLMDEPFSHLDESLSHALQRELLSLLAAFSSTLIYVTHNRRETESLATKVIAIAASMSPF